MMFEPRSPSATQLTCTKCKTNKPVCDFGMRSGGRYHSWCRQCRKNWDRVERHLSQPRSVQQHAT